MNKTLFGKILIISLIIIFVVTGITAISMNFFIRQYILHSKQQDMIRQGRRVVDVVTSRFERMDPLSGKPKEPSDIWLQRLGSLIRGMEEVLGGRIWLMDAEGMVYVGTVPIRQLTPKQLTQLKSGKPVTNLKWYDEKNRSILAVALPVSYRGEVVSGVFITTLMQDIHRVQLQIRQLLMLSALIAGLAAVLVAYIFSRHVTRPIHAMRSLIIRMRQGDFSGMIEVKREDELGDLARHFNDLNRELNETMRLLSTEQEQTQRIINSMAEGMISLNREGAVLLLNPAARRILQVSGEETVDAKALLQQLPGLDEMVQQIVQEKTTVLREFEHNGQVYHATGSTILTGPEVSGVVMILQDVTNRWRLIELQKEVIANVSHEFKTPLTSIRGFVELMLDRKIADATASENALQVIHHETTRLIRMVNDLLRTARLEALRLKKEPVQLMELVQNVAESLRLRLQETGVTIALDPTLNQEMLLDPDRMEQVFYNLLENAIRFTPAGTEVEVTLGKLPAGVEIRIRDHGPGVPAAQQEVIFDRFYKVSKARSSDHSGFGLGLAIVKNIVEEHGGRIRVTNHPQGGAVFIIRLPG